MVAKLISARNRTTLFIKLEVRIEPAVSRATGYSRHSGIYRHGKDITACGGLPLHGTVAFKPTSLEIVLHLRDCIFDTPGIDNLETWRDIREDHPGYRSSVYFQKVQ